MEKPEVEAYLHEVALRRYEQREAELGAEQFHEVERLILLKNVDIKWMEHLDAMDQLRQGINLRAYAQRNPVDEYKNEKPGHLCHHGDHGIWLLRTFPLLAKSRVSGQ